MYRFRVNGRPIRHIFHRFQNVPASCKRSLNAVLPRSRVFRFQALYNSLGFLLKRSTKGSSLISNGMLSQALRPVFPLLLMETRDFP